MRSCCFVCLCRACLCERSSSKSKCWTETSSTLCIAQLRNSDFTSSSIYLYKSYMRLVMWWRGPLHSSLLSKMSQTASRSSSSEPHRSLFRYRLVSPTCIIGSRSSSGYIVASSCFLSRSAILSSGDFCKFESSVTLLSFAVVRHSRFRVREAPDRVFKGTHEPLQWQSTIPNEYCCR
jgi:hypothetical protein